MKRCPPQTMCAFHFLNKSNLVSKYLPDAKAHVLCAFGVHGDEGWTLVVIPCRSLSIGVVKSPHCKKIYSFAKFASLFNCVFAVIVLRFA